MNKAIMKKLKDMKACGAGVEWVNTMPNASTAWRICKRGDWMLWYAAHMSITKAQRRKVLIAVVKCAHLRIKYDTDRCSHLLDILDKAEAWAKDLYTDAYILDVMNALNLTSETDICNLVSGITCWAVQGDMELLTDQSAAFYASGVVDVIIEELTDFELIAVMTEGFVKLIREECANIVRSVYPRCPR